MHHHTLQLNCCRNSCRNDTLEDSAFEPVAKPAEPDIEALPENSDPHALSDDPVMSAVPEIFEHPQELPQQPAESSDAAVEAVLADMQNATEAAVAEQQVLPPGAAVSMLTAYPGLLCEFATQRMNEHHESTHCVTHSFCSTLPCATVHVLVHYRAVCCKRCRVSK